MSAHDLFVGVHRPLAIDRKEVVLMAALKDDFGASRPSPFCPLTTLSHCYASECSGRPLPPPALDVPYHSPGAPWPPPVDDVLRRLCLRRAPPANLPKAGRYPSQPPVAPRSALASLLDSLLESPSPALTAATWDASKVALSCSPASTFAQVSHSTFVDAQQHFHQRRRDNQ